MKTLFISLLLIVSLNAFSQTDSLHVKTKKACRGYDLVSYHQFEKPALGVKEYSYIYSDRNFNFISEENLELFKVDPDKYLPQYDGNCAYGIALSGKQYWGNPKSYEIYDGKLYFFYKRTFLDYRKKWLKKGANSLRTKADENWKIQSND